MERPHCKESMKMSLCLTFEIVPPTVDQASLVHFVAQADLKHTTLLLLQPLRCSHSWHVRPPGTAIQALNTELK